MSVGSQSEGQLSCCDARAVSPVVQDLRDVARDRSSNTLRVGVIRIHNDPSSAKFPHVSQSVGTFESEAGLHGFCLGARTRHMEPVAEITGHCFVVGN